ncbi:MAG: redoxin domain-containing protein [Candidatus Latescibacteria bacterium]|nr:redoxin domain-containing protein [bacterium]MBD3425222.1 redoxin domain-containing protein [Candidatus Latescibacterota bacterium]
MNITGLRRAAGIISIITLILLSCSGDKPEQRVEQIGSDPEAARIYREMRETIRDAQTIYYESEYLWTSDTLELAHTNYELSMKKPNFARVEARGIENSSEGVLIGDGEHFWIYWPTGRPRFPGTDSATYERTRNISYMKKPAPAGAHSIAHDVGLFGTNVISMTVLEPSIFHGYSDPMQPYLNGVEYVERDTVGGIECDVIEAVFMDHQRVKTFWVSREDHLPRRMLETVYANPISETREEWSNVQLNHPLPDDLFSWEPPEGWVEYRQPRLEDGLLPIGEIAPDFELSLADSGRFKLSDHRGEVVWIIFWKSGCQPCRKEMEYIHNIIGRYETGDLTILGFNCIDNRDVASKYLKKYNIPFLHIVDSSEQARNTSFNEYQRLPGMSAVPLNYLIDRRGRIAVAWYGFDRESERIEKIMKKMDEL